MIAFGVLQQQINQIRRFSSNPSNITFSYSSDRKSVNKSLNNDFWKNVKVADKQPAMSNDDALRFLTTLGATKWQYTNGVSNLDAVSPDTWGHVQPLLDREGNQDVQLQMFYSYGTNPRCIRPGKNPFVPISSQP
jgi:hypothetical protein